MNNIEWMDDYFSTVKKLASVSDVTLKEAFEAGRDCACSGANKVNCHFRFFRSEELTAAWKRGRRNDRNDNRSI